MTLPLPASPSSRPPEVRGRRRRDALAVAGIGALVVALAALATVAGGQEPAGDVVAPRVAAPALEPAGDGLGAPLAVLALVAAAAAAGLTALVATVLMRPPQRHPSTR